MHSLSRNSYWNIRALSSVGSEHLVYTEGVGGSNPSAPTKKPTHLSGFFLSAYKLRLIKLFASAGKLFNVLLLGDVVYWDKTSATVKKLPVTRIKSLFCDSFLATDSASFTVS